MAASSDLVARFQNWFTPKPDERLTLISEGITTLKATILALEADKAALVGALTELRDTVRASGKLEGREYISVGIRVNDALAKHRGNK